MPKLLAKAEALEAGPGGAGLPEERGARYHLLQGAAQPLFYLSAGERAAADAGDSYEARLQARCRGAAGELEVAEGRCKTDGGPRGVLPAGNAGRDGRAARRVTSLRRDGYRWRWRAERRVQQHGALIQEL